MDQLALTSQDDLTMSIVESGVVTWDDLIRVVQQFHYGRNQNREDLTLVWTERKGTCSSKHAFLKLVADLNQFDGIELVLCMYRMNGTNTPGVGAVLDKYQLEFIPEAHCYLSTSTGIIDVTSAQSDFNRISGDILCEEVIKPSDVASYKVEYHKAFIHDWAAKNTAKSVEEIWEIREECIVGLEQ